MRHGGLTVLLDALPLMSNGKIDRRALCRHPTGSRPELDKMFVACPALRQRCYWQRFGPSFSTLSGLVSTTISSSSAAIRSWRRSSSCAFAKPSRVEIPLGRLFEAPTVAGLAESIEAARQGRAEPVGTAHRADSPGRGPGSSFAQQRLWFFDQLGPGTVGLQYPAAVRLKGPLNMAALERSLNEIVKAPRNLAHHLWEGGGAAHASDRPGLDDQIVGR